MQTIWQKVLCRKENKELCSTIERYTDGLIFTTQMNEIIETLSAAKAPKTDGKGNPYVDVLRGHVALLDATTHSIQKSIPGCVYKIKKKLNLERKVCCQIFVVHLFKIPVIHEEKIWNECGTNTQVSDMRIWHVDTSARLSAKAAHEMQTFLHELRKLKNANEHLTQTKTK